MARGNNLMLGYWNDARATHEAIRDGWLRTGDLASRDGEGYFYVRARKNDLVKLQGFRVHPREVEDAISRHFPALRIIVVPYQERGVTRLALYAITSAFELGLVDRIRRTCLRDLPRHKVPQHIELLTRAPLNASLKLDRTALRGGPSSAPWPSAKTTPAVTHGEGGPRETRASPDRFAKDR